MNPSVGRRAAAGVAAGLAGGILIDAFLFGVQIAEGAPAGSVVMGTWTFVAAAVLGASALTNPAAPLIGALLHLAVSVFWALGYVYLTHSQPQLLSRPWISGAAFGLVVYVFMQVILLAAGAYHPPTPAALGTALAAHLLFYGVPVALVVSRMLRRPNAA